MSGHPDWLPQLITYDAYNGRWDDFIEDVYQAFCDDFHNNRKPNLKYDNRKITSKRSPLVNGKPDSFWHVISGDINNGSSNGPEVPRCERIKWIRPIIENHLHEQVLIWEEPEKRGAKTRTLFWLKDHDYLVIIANRTEYSILWTAYHIEYPHKRRKLQIRHDEYHKANTASQG